MATQPVAPPDMEAENHLLRMRVHASEAALYAFETELRELLEKRIQPIVRQMHALSQQFPIGDDTSEGARGLALNAIRASMPQYKDSTDEQLLQLFFTPKQP